MRNKQKKQPFKEIRENRLKLYEERSQQDAKFQKEALKFMKTFNNKQEQMYLERRALCTQGNVIIQLMMLQAEK